MGARLRGAGRDFRAKPRTRAGPGGNKRGQGQTGISIWSVVHAVALLSEAFDHKRGNFGIIFNDENTHGVHGKMRKTSKR